MQTWGAKATGEVVRYEWKVPVADCDSLDDYTASASGATIDAQDTDGNSVILFVSGGTAGSTATITLVAFTTGGETLDETIYIPILPDANAAAFGETAQDIVDYALRPIVGLGGTATSTEQDDALEWLNGLLATWKGQGADVGAPLPLSLASVVYCPDEWLLAIKNNLRVMVAEQYGRQVAPTTAALAARGLQLIKNGNIPDERKQAAYY